MYRPDIIVICIFTGLREEFENTVYTYRCFTYDGNVGLSDPNRVISNEVTVDPPGESVLVYIMTYVYS